MFYVNMFNVTLYCQVYLMLNIYTRKRRLKILENNDRNCISNAYHARSYNVRQGVR